MKFRVLVLSFVAGLLFQTTSVVAAEQQGQPAQAETGALSSTQNPQVWGDPEESEENESVWTWFGMGYEMRNQGSSQSADSPADVVTGGKGKQQHGRK
jgi:hypothetical protein